MKGTITSELHTLVSGLVVGESPRWHEGRLWFANWGAQEIRTVDAHGNGEVKAKGPKLAGFSIDWLPTGELLVTGEGRLLRRSADGSFVTHADLSALGESWNEVTVDGRGNIYVNDVGFRFGQEQFRPGTIALVTPDGTLSNRRVWAPVTGDGICLDAEGAIWCSGVAGDQPECLRVREGGEVLDRIILDAACFACMLGGEDGKTLFMMTAEWRGIERMGELFQSRTGQVQALAVQVPHAGRP